METRFARRPAAARLRHANFFSRFVIKSLHTASHLARPTPALKFIAALAAIGLFAGIPANALITPTAPVGATPGSFAVGPSGAATYTIPIVVAPGTNGMQPNLSLVYNSQGGNGLLGVGWALGGLSVIHRCGATFEIDGFKGGVNYDANDRFCMDGERLISIGSNQYRTYQESLQKVVATGAATNPDYFVVTDKTGTTREYTVPIEAAGNPNIRRLWALSKIRDRQGNYLTINYDKNDVAASGDYRPSSIAYTANDAAAVAAYNSIAFEYLPPGSGVASIYEGGSIIKTLKLLTKITSYAGTTKVREYRLTYDNGGAGSRSRVTSIQECGTDGACLPATTFGWQSGGNGTFGPMVRADFISYGVGSMHLQSLMADVNGDGLMDVVHRENASVLVSLQNQNGSFGPMVRTDFISYGVGNMHLQSIMADVNGDGLADVVHRENASILVALSRGDGTFGPMVRADFISYGVGSMHLQSLMADVNGDGLMDVVHRENASVLVSLQNQNGSFGPMVRTDFISYGVGSMHIYSLLVDVNGDGLADVVHRENTSVLVALARSDGTFGPMVRSDFLPYGVGDVHEQSLFMDVNGDGKADVIHRENASVLVALSRGDGTFGPMVRTDFISYGVGSMHLQSILADVNGDGLNDIIHRENASVLVALSKGDGTFGPMVRTDFLGFGVGSMHLYSAVEEISGDGLADVLHPENASVLIARANGVTPDLLTSVTNGFGVQSNVVYKPLTEGAPFYIKDTTSAYPYRDIRNATYVVSQANQSNGLPGGVNTTTYQYSGVKEHWRAATLLGFRRIESTGPDGIVQRTDYNQNREAGIDGTVAASGAYVSGVWLKYVANTWVQSAASVCGGTQQPQLTLSVETTRELNGNLITQINTSNTYDTCGFPTSTIVDFNDGWRKTVTNTATNDTASWCLGQITQSQVTTEAPGVAPKIRTSGFTYANCLVASETIEPGSALAITTTYGYDAFGNRTSKTISGSDIVTRTESQVYDSNGRFVVSSTNALGHTTTFGYDARGLLASQTDANGLTTTSDYDGFGRKRIEVRPDGTQTTITYDVRATGYAVSTFTPGAANTYTDYDILGREIRAATKGFGGRWIFRNKGYDTIGRVDRVSQPYFDGDPAYDTTFAYDAIGRATSVTAPGTGSRTTITEYSGLSTTVRNPKNKPTTTIKNSQGKVVSVADSAGTTSYVYDPFLNLTQVTDAAGNVTTMSYDLRGRKTAMHDPDMGNWSYSYDVLSQLKSQTDAKGQLISMNYDKLGRMVSRTTPEGTSTWTYDTATKGVGKLASVTGPGGYQESYTYDLVSRPSITTTTIAGANYAVTTTYDMFGRLDTITYPITGYKVKQIYDDFGYLLQVDRLKSDGTESLLWKTYNADAFNHVTGETFWNLVNSQRIYDPATADLLSIQTGSGGSNTQNIQNLTYGWDELHNLTSRTDTITSLNETFTYDDVNRITAATGAVAKSYAYDAIGNITSKSDVGTYSYNASGPSSVRPHAVTAVTGVVNSTYTYDANGNMLSGGGRTLTYTSFNKPQSIAGASGTTTLSYDANYNRIQKQTSTRTTAYVGKLFERVTTGTLVEHKHYIYGGKSLVATYTERNNGTQPETRYVHTDHLDSVSVITDDNGAVVERLSFDPFGKRRQTNGQDAISPITSSINRGFTRHEQDDEVALINMNARLYDPMLGRFITSDTVVDSAAGQGLNRYSYVRNNPLSLTDPSGHRSLSRVIKNVERAYIKYQVFNAYVGVGFFLGGPEGALAGAKAFSDTNKAYNRGVRGGDLFKVGLSSGLDAYSRLSGITGPLNAMYQGVVQYAGSAGAVVGLAQYKADRYIQGEISEEFGKIAYRNGMSLTQFNMTLFGLSALGESRFDPDRKVQMNGVNTRGRTGWFFDVVDTALEIQGVPSASGVHYLASNLRGQAITGHSLGALTVANLESRGIMSGSTALALPFVKIQMPGTEVRLHVDDPVSAWRIGLVLHPGAIVDQGPGNGAGFPASHRLNGFEGYN